MQTGITLDQFGARPVVGRLVSASIVKEVGPVFTGLMQALRAQLIACVTRGTRVRVDFFRACSIH